MRNNQVILVAGTRGVGKTDFLKMVMQSSNMPKKLLVDTFDSQVWHNMKTWNHPEWENVNVPSLPITHLPHWNSGLYRLWDSDTNKVLQMIDKYCKNTLIVCEDATKYIGSRLDPNTRKFVLDSKQKNLDIVFVFHNLAAIPRELVRVADMLTIFKTNETMDSTLKSKYPFPALYKVFEEVKNSSNRHINKTIRLN